MKNLMPYPRMCCFCKDMTLGFGKQALFLRLPFRERRKVAHDVARPSIAFAVAFQSPCLYCYFSAPGADGAVLGVEHTELAWSDALNFL